MDDARWEGFDYATTEELGKAITALLAATDGAAGGPATAARIGDVRRNGYQNPRDVHCWSVALPEAAAPPWPSSPPR